eukprot:gene754-1439_t
MSSFIADAANQCQYCQVRFLSRNKLFKHLKSCQTQTGGITGGDQSLSLTTLNVNLNLVNAYIYVTGGRIRGKTLGSVERYIQSDGKWEICPPMLENRGSHCAAGVDSKLFVFGGGGFRSNLSNCEVYDPLTNVWTRTSPMQSCRHALSATVLHDKVYAIGGWENGSKCCDTVECYDVQTNSWSFCAPMPTARRLLGVTVHAGHIYAFGGNRDDPDWYTSHAEAFDPSLNIWRSLRNMPLSGGAGTAAVGDFIYIFVHGQRVLKYCPTSDSYHTLSSLPLPEWFCFDVVTINAEIYILGGATVGKWTQAAYSYNTLTDTWTPLPPMIKARRRCAAALVLVPKTMMKDNTCVDDIVVVEDNKGEIESHTVSGKRKNGDDGGSCVS